MKKHFLKLFFFLALIPFHLSAASYDDKPTDPQEDLFDLDEAALAAAMTELDALEEYIKEHEGTTLSSLTEARHPMAEELSGEGLPQQLTSEPPLGLPPFLWGFCFGTPGIIIVYLITEEDMFATKKAFTGVLSRLGLLMLLYLIYGILAVSVLGGI